jgi:hypothetical protein
MSHSPTAVATDDQEVPSVSYWSVQPNRWTFQSPKVKAWVEHHLDGRVLNACCGITHLEHDAEIVRNDLQHRITHDDTVCETDADTHVDVHSLTSEFPENAFDTVVFDPPFSDHQSSQSYSLTRGVDQGSVADELDAVLKPGGTLVACGFTTLPLGATPGYAVDSVAVWNLLGRQRDWLGIALTNADQDALPGTTRRAAGVPNPIETLPALSGTGVVGGGNDGHPIALTYQRLAADTSCPRAAASTAVDNCTGHVLVVGEDIRQYRDVYSGPVTLNTPDGWSGRDTQFAIQELAAAFEPARFTHIVLDLPPAAAQKTVEYDGARTGFDTVAKQQVHRLLAAGGTVTMVGQTATVMSTANYDCYRRQSVTVLAHPSHDRDTIVATDRHIGDTETMASPPPLAETALADGRPTDIMVSPAVWSGTARWGCERCGTAWYWHPAYHTDCPACGARPENYCVDDSDTPLEGIHTHRVAAWQQRHIGAHDTRDLAVERLDAAAGFGGVPDDDQTYLSGFKD